MEIRKILKFKNPWEDDIVNTEKDKNNKKSGDITSQIDKLKKDIFRILKIDPSSNNHNNNNGEKGLNLSFNSLLIPIAVAIIAWLLTGIYTIDVNEEGVVLRFGKYNRTSNRGLNYKLPYPIESVEKVNITRIIKETIGLKTNTTNSMYSNRNISNSNANRGSSREDLNFEKRYESSLNKWANNNNQASLTYTNNSQERGQEEQMLTGDENMIDIQFFVQWYINDGKKYLFNLKHNNYEDNTVRAISESAMRRVVGEMRLYDALSEKREEIETKVQEMVQDILDNYNSGIKITSVGILYSYVAPDVMDAYRDVQSSKADKEREINQAYSYRNNIIPRARGEAKAIIEEATAYKESVIAKAKGEAQKFSAILKEYKNAKDIVGTKIYLETMESILPNMNKVIIDSSTGAISGNSSGNGNSNSGHPGTGNAVIPFLNLNDTFKNQKQNYTNNVDNIHPDLEKNSESSKSKSNN